MACNTTQGVSSQTIVVCSFGEGQNGKQAALGGSVTSNPHQVPREMTKALRRPGRAPSVSQLLRPLLFRVGLGRGSDARTFLIRAAFGIPLHLRFHTVRLGG